MLHEKSLSHIDRIVIVGNHRDAWVYGAADPSSGTAVMVEVVRAIGWLKSKGDVLLKRLSDFLLHLWLK